MLTADELQSRHEEITAAPELAALLQRLTERADPVLQRMPPIPTVKAMLTTDGGACPQDGVRLEFDPWNPTEHRCPRCARRFSGERHDWAWAHQQHLWLAERAAHLAAVAAMAGREDAAARATELLLAYRNYGEFPNRDNVLGPSRLFFSTYLESIWLSNYLSAAMLLRDAGLLDAESEAIVSAVADDAANLIGEFDEGLSNRQTWNNAALSGTAVWFEDEELATRMIEGRSGILTHLLQGFGPDGMWYEGDNYHLFALRGLLVSMGWARQAGVDLLADARLAARLGAALRAPALTALPDGTFPARKDSRFGVSLAQPMYLELWEVGLARLERAGVGAAQADLWDWLRLLYQAPAPVAQTFDSYLHEAGEHPPDRRTRSDLSWWALLEMLPSLPAEGGSWSPESVFIEGQGFAILRQGDRYAGLECGAYGGGHGHPDRLNLILHAGGEYWLPDLGTGSYVARDLFWYRSTLAHNAPRLDGKSQPVTDAVCDNFEQQGAWGWARGRFGDLTRTVVSGPRYILDVVELAAAGDHVLELPLHLTGHTDVEPAGSWAPADWTEEFVAGAERYVGSAPPTRLLSSGPSGARLSVWLEFSGDLLRARAPGAPGTAEPAQFYLVRSRGGSVRIVTVLEPLTSEPSVTGVRAAGTGIEVSTKAGAERHIPTVEGWEVRTGNETVRLRGGRKQGAPFTPLVQHRPLVAHGLALQVAEPPLDGTLDGFETSSALELDHEDQYRRSEEPYPGPEELAARAYVNWSDEGLYVAVEVTKPELVLRNPTAAPLRLDNEPDEIHADGVQLYIRLPAEDSAYGFLVVPSSAGDLIVRGVDGTLGRAEMVSGNWARTDTGYLVTVGVSLPQLAELRVGEEIGFDLLINQMLPERLRRASQLVWSGGGGWVWLRGDRQDPALFGTLQLA